MSEQQPVEPYQTFLQTKQVRVQPVGMEIALTDLHSRLFPFQRALVQWALRLGRKFVGVELKESYFQVARKNLGRMVREKTQATLFDDAVLDEGEVTA